MNEDCDAENVRKKNDDGMVSVRFNFGAIVVAKVGHFPYWPAMVDTCPDTGETYWIEKFDDPKQKRATHYHVVFFDGGGKVTRSWVHTNRIADYTVHHPMELTPEELSAARKLKPTAKQRTFIEARALAESALKMSVEERTQKYAFIHTYKGKITLFGSRKKNKRGRKPKPKAHDAPQENVGAPARKRPGKPKPKPSPSVPEISNETSQSQRDARLRRRSARIAVGSANSSSVELPTDSDSEDERKGDLPSESQTGQSHSPSKPHSTPRASSELNEELSGFATSYPPSPETVLQKMPKRRGRKRKGAKQYTAKKKAKAAEVPFVSAISPAAEDTQVHITTSHEEVSKSTTAALSPPSTVTETPASIAKPTCGTDVPFDASVTVTPTTPAEADDAEPEETLEMKMSSVLQRMQQETQLPERLQTKKTVSNVGFMVDAADPVIDLTDEVEQVTGIPWERGEVVFAHLKGMPPWPAVIDVDPADNLYFTPSEEPEYVHVVFLELSQSAWVPLKNVTVCDESRLEEAEPMSFKFLNAVKNARQALALPKGLRTVKYGSSTVNVVSCLQ